MNRILIPYWQQTASEPEPSGDLRILLDFGQLTAISIGQTGSEPLEDLDTTDGQSNDSGVDWDYTPAGGYAKPTFTGSGLVGAIGDFLGFNILSPPITPIGETGFESYMLCRNTAASATSGYYVLFSVSTDLCFFQVKVSATAGPGLALFVEVTENANPFTSLVTVGPVAITSGANEAYGFRVSNATPGGFDLDLLMNGTPITAGSGTSYPLGEVTGLGFSLGTVSGASVISDSLIELYTMELYNIGS